MRQPNALGLEWLAIAIELPAWLVRRVRQGEDGRRQARIVVAWDGRVLYIAHRGRDDGPLSRLVFVTQGEQATEKGCDAHCE